MADAFAFLRHPTEKLSEFNARIKKGCDEMDVTEVMLEIVDGMPLVVLLAETEEADEEAVEAAKDAGDSIKLGELIPVSDPMHVKVVKVSGRISPEAMADKKVSKDDNARTSEENLEKVYQHANGLIVNHLYADGPDLSSEDLRHKVHYVAVCYIQEEAAPTDDGKLSTTLRQPAT